MTNTTRLAGTFKGWRMKYAIAPEKLMDALKFCREAGLAPEVRGDQDGYVCFHFHLPDGPDGEDQREKAMVEVGKLTEGHLIYCARVTLVCPPPKTA